MPKINLKPLYLADKSQLFNPFSPFGKGVRIDTTNVIEGDRELLACLNDLCVLHNVNFKQALHFEYPSGSIAMLRQTQGGFNDCPYLTEQAYSVFMAWVKVLP